MILLRNNKPGFEDTEEVNYWKSTSDMLAALLLIVMLIMMVILINLFDKQNELNEHTSDYRYEHIDYVDPWPGDSTYTGDGRYDHESYGGGGGAGSVDPVPVNEHTDDYEKPEYTNEYEEGSDRSAVYTVVKDAETGSIILNETVGFRLYDSEGIIQTLSTYYPVKTTYDTFVTTESGSFYIPEKIALGSYSLRQVTDIKGYDRANSTEFTIDGNYTWKEPYVVTVNVYPSRNTIKLKLTDSKTTNGISGVVFNVYAQEDIITADGTLRIPKGQLADTVTTDVNGFAETRELYLGEYRIEETEIPFGYAAYISEEPVSIGKKGDSASAELEIACEMTEVDVHLCDELQESKYLNGAVFILQGDDTERAFETKGTGNISITGLEKDTEYKLKQLSFAEGYDSTTKSVEFYVDKNGYIDASSKLELELKNRIIRIEIKTTDSILRKNVDGKSVVMYDEKGTEICQWTSGKTAYYIEGIQSGTYYLEIDGSQDHRTQIDVLSTSSVQTFECSLITVQSKIILGVSAFLGISAIGTVSWSIFRKKTTGRKEDVNE